MIGQRKCVITFICLGNICRSPLAAYIFETLLEKLCPLLSSHIIINSAATAPHTRGQAADDRAIRMAKQIEQQHNLTGLYNRMLRHRAKKIPNNLLIESDFLVVMDLDNYDDILKQLSAINKNTKEERIFYFGNFSRLATKNLIDYQGNGDIKKEIMLKFVKQTPDIIIRDPWYGTMSDFERVAQISIESSKGLLQFLRSIISESDSL